MRSVYVQSSVLRMLVNSMAYENGVAMRVCSETGLRIGDVLSLRPSDLKGNRLSYVAHKTGKAGVKLLSSDLAACLRRVSGKSWIFPGRDPQKHRSRQAVYLDLKKVCREYGLTGQISPHSARKTYAVEEYRQYGLEAVQRELQHSDVHTTLMYALSDSDEAFDLSEIVHRLAVIEDLCRQILASLGS